VNATIAGAIEAKRELAASEPRTTAAAQGVRHRLFVWSLATDIMLALVSYELAMVVFAWFHRSELNLLPERFDWGVPISLAAIFITFLMLGLYKMEVYASRPLQLMLLAKGTLVALVITAFLTFAIKSPLVTDSRLTIFVTFGLFFVLISVARLRYVDRTYQRDVQQRRGPTVIVGWQGEDGVLVGRLKELRGFAQVRTLEPKDRRRNGYDAEPVLVATLQRAEPAPRQVFLEGNVLGHKATLDLVRTARGRGCEVYITGRLVRPLDSTGVLMRLFEVPAMRVRRDPVVGCSRRSRRLVRAFDIAASGAALLLLLPVFAVIAVAIKLGSRGPVFFRQERVGLCGRSFEFLKFRSMTAGNDASGHKEALAAFIHGEHQECLAQTDEWGRPVFKMTADARVTRVGRFIRRYSLDELPQFWNVFKGDMSMVGPRPALPYEVEAYKPWHEQRLQVTPGVSGLWQVCGRSRVEFDDMVFQDIVYGYNQSFLTDAHICLRTVPAVLMGTGAA
jgi:exopolysaccharide biosynthesis polyprenyl glycosylphosphotransferase